MKLQKLLLASLLISSYTQGATLTQWNFDADNLIPNVGAGTATLIGGATATFAAGVGASSKAWNTSAYKAQGTGSGQAGVQFNVNTTGQKDIVISFSHRASGTASRWAQLEYTSDASASTPIWEVAGNNSGALSPHDTFYAFSFDLKSITSINNNANFAFRIVNIFSPTAFDQNASLGDFAANTNYMRANAQASYTVGGGTGSGDYGTGGTWRFDNVTVAVPEPTTALLSAFGALALLRRRR